MYKTSKNKLKLRGFQLYYISNSCSSYVSYDNVRDQNSKNIRLHHTINKGVHKKPPYNDPSVSKGRFYPNMAIICTYFYFSDVSWYTHYFLTSQV